MRKRGRVDESQEEIVKALRKAGATVQSLAAIGKGCPDLLVAKAQRCYLLEVKSENQPPSKQRLTPDEAKWIANWRAPVYIVKSPAEAIGLLQLISK